jgi:hypothetical protein
MIFPMQRRCNRLNSEECLSAESGNENDTAEALRRICSSTLNTAFPAFRHKEVEACFYPYIGLTHTIRRKESKWVIRISDHCCKAPVPVLEAIIMILACKVAGKKPCRELLQTYEFFRKDPQVAEAVRKRRQLKGRKYISSEEGKYHSPRKILQELNSRFFNNQVEIRRIGWGLQRSLSRLGHYDSIHRTVTLSPVLDSPKVPKLVVRYVIYHEMLHAVFEDTPARGSGRHHSKEFRRAERAYPDFARAKKFLRGFSSSRLDGVC